MMTTVAQDSIMWEPTGEVLENARVARFMREHGIATYDELVTRSIDDPSWFWDAVVTFLGIPFSTPYTAVLDADDPRFPEWFAGGHMNAADVCVFQHATGTSASRRAIVWQGEDDGEREMTYADLRREVAVLAEGLLELGVTQGDTVAIYLPMVPEVAVAFYACAAIGAIAVPIFSGFAAQAVHQRLDHSQAKVIICADGTYRRSRVVTMKHTIDDAIVDAPSVEHVVVLRRLGTTVPFTEGRDVWWHELTRDQPGTFTPVALASETPLMLAYTSGTTGTPKAAVHVHGGFTVKIAEEAAFQTDIGPDDVVHWVTDMGWIMGPWEVIGAHANGATLVLFEGAPNFPNPDRLWCLVEKFGITVLGISPTLIRALMAEGNDWLNGHDMPSLRILASTGEPWNPEPYRWLSETVAGGRCPIINLSGGTEVGACFLSPTPLSTLKTCSLGGPALGMAIEVRDPNTAERLGPGDGVGELVCARPWPGMTRGFWGEDGHDRYIETYWSRWPSVWVHGDWASIDDDGEWYLHGRSDDTINVAGKRIGPAEYESILVEHESVAETAAVGVPHDVKGEVVWCYVVLNPGRRQSDRLKESLVDMVAEHLGKAFRPARVEVVKGLPKTRSQKIVRRAIRAAAMGEDQGDISMIENPRVLKYFHG